MENTVSVYPSEVWTDTVYHYDYPGEHGITYEGTGGDIPIDTMAIPGWKTRDDGRVADKDTENSRIVIRIWCWGFDFYTYVDQHHGSYTISVDGEETYVDITNPTREAQKTFSQEFMTYSNHEIIITPQPDSTFVFEKFVKWVDSNPGQPGPEPPIYPCDSIVYIDSIVYVDRIVYVDSIVYKTDTLYLTPINKYFFLPDSVAVEFK